MLGRGNNFGQYDRELRILQPVYVTDASTNEETVSGYTLFATVWGKRLSQPSREIYESAQLVALKTVRYETRFLDGVLETFIVDDGDEKLRIIGVERFDRQSRLIITTQKRDNDEPFFET